MTAAPVSWLYFEKLALCQCLEMSVYPDLALAFPKHKRTPLVESFCVFQGKSVHLNLYLKFFKILKAYIRELIKYENTDLRRENEICQVSLRFNFTN
jgi:hypothetical protein